MSSPTSLPRTWRPLGTRLAGWFFGLMLLVVCTAAWLTFDDEVKDALTWGQRITLLGLGALAGAAFNGLMRSRLRATTDGLVVVNGYRARTYTWAQVVAINLPQGAPWATLDLADGTSVAAVGIQGSDGDRARAAVREVRELLARFHESATDD